MGGDLSMGSRQLSVDGRSLEVFALSTLIVQGLAPSGHRLDWVGAYGAGSGADYIFARHLALRAQSDVIHKHPFSDILLNGRWTLRYSIGPSFNFGRNIPSNKH
jgi:hypothetical protein